MSSYAPLGRQGKLKSQGMSRDLFGSRTKHLSKSKLPRCCFAHKPRYPEGLRPFGAKNLHACVFFARRAKCSHTRWHASCISKNCAIARASGQKYYICVYQISLLIGYLSTWERPTINHSGETQCPRPLLKSKNLLLQKQSTFSLATMRLHFHPVRIRLYLSPPRLKVISLVALPALALQPIGHVPSRPSACCFKSWDVPESMLQTTSSSFGMTFPVCQRRRWSLGWVR